MDYAGRLDRDKDSQDLKSCPPGFVDNGFELHKQSVFAADVYLRKCKATPISVEWTKLPPETAQTAVHAAVASTGIPDKPSGAFLQIGDSVQLLNDFMNGQGGYLDVNDVGCQKNLLCVSTSPTQERDANSTHWTIRVPGKQDGAPLQIGDRVQLENRYNFDNRGNGGYLDVNGAGCQGNLRCVSTSPTRERDHGSTYWKIRALDKPLG